MTAQHTATGAPQRCDRVGTWHSRDRKNPCAWSMRAPTGPSSTTPSCSWRAWAAGLPAPGARRRAHPAPARQRPVPCCPAASRSASTRRAAPRSSATKTARTSCAVAAFLAPAWTMFLHPAYRALATRPRSPCSRTRRSASPTDQFWATGVRVDEDMRQDPWRFDAKRLAEAGGEASSRRWATTSSCSSSRQCALDYGCRAAQNYFIGRHEAPIPTSVACNSKCIGCISLQPDGEFRASHDRIRRAPRRRTRSPTWRVGHIERVPDGVVSFGQGCEGEPLLGRDLLPDAMRQIRARTSHGTINVNTNGSLPECGRRHVPRRAWTRFGSP